MTEAIGVVASVTDRLREQFDAPGRGDASWFTLFSADLTATKGMIAGVMELEPGGVGLRPHRHEQPEIYFIIEGSGMLEIGGLESRVDRGAAAFIPGDAVHGLRNVGDTRLRVFYVFPADRFADVIYRFG